jgi:hypothetical protein
MFQRYWNCIKSSFNTFLPLLQHTKAHIITPTQMCNFVHFCAKKCAFGCLCTFRNYGIVRGVALAFEYNSSLKQHFTMLKQEKLGKFKSKTCNLSCKYPIRPPYPLCPTTCSSGHNLLLEKTLCVFLQGWIPSSSHLCDMLRLKIGN